MTNFHNFNPNICPVCNKDITVNPAREYRVVVNGTKCWVMAHEICVRAVFAEYLSGKYADEVKE